MSATIDATTDLRAYAAVLSDLDGTLIDSAGPVRRAWAGFAQRQGLELERVLHQAQGRPARETAAELAPQAPEEPALLEHAEITDTDGVLALPGAAALLGARLTVALVTSCTHRLALARLAAAGLPAPATIISADDVRRGKPDPEPFRCAAQRLGVPAGSCVVLEDAPAGIAAGKAAGMTVIALPTTHAPGELHEADLIVGSLTELDLG